MDALTAALEAEGYEVTLVTADPARTEFAGAPTGDFDGADAVLDTIADRYGVIQTDGTWRPHMQTRVRLTRLSDGKVQMQNMVSFTSAISTGSNLVIVAESDFAWSSFDGLIAEPDRAVAGITLALTRSAEAIAGLLR